MKSEILAAVAAASFLAAIPMSSMAQAAAPEQSAASSAPSSASGSSPRTSAQRLSPERKPVLDRTGEKRIGKASFYAHMFEGRKMADGRVMDPARNNAASRTLPLGTTAKV